MQLEHLTINNDGVPGVDPTLITDDDVSGPAQQIGDLSLALVTPLSTDDDTVGQSKGDSRPRCEQSAIFSDQLLLSQNQLPRATPISALCNSFSKRARRSSDSGRRCSWRSGREGVQRGLHRREGGQAVDAAVGSIQGDVVVDQIPGLLLRSLLACPSSEQWCSAGSWRRSWCRRHMTQ